LTAPFLGAARPRDPERGGSFSSRPPNVLPPPFGPMPRVPPVLAVHRSRENDEVPHRARRGLIRGGFLFRRRSPKAHLMKKKRETAPRKRPTRNLVTLELRWPFFHRADRSSRPETSFQLKNPVARVPLACKLGLRTPRHRKNGRPPLGSLSLGSRRIEAPFPMSKSLPSSGHQGFLFRPPPQPPRLWEPGNGPRPALPSQAGVARGEAPFVLLPRLALRTPPPLSR